jgi:hypothetical protein
MAGPVQKNQCGSTVWLLKKGIAPAMMTGAMPALVKR